MDKTGGPLWLTKSRRIRGWWAAAGAAPLLLGQPGYRAELDRDGDGVACEW
ncbi:hypothetical protein BN2537_563 [Streptomyces venezuelae]|uniref:excalibur calcium-binding domain-containing protein n=1 Tax=Streptomyces gardneri TaxID=66892 RepID=UPI0006BDCF31|nr:excalibur calcium-binding domain-containing protein [Streptomyces gardneri]WRK41683.1 excalibur calcium-binding domain-containing protein [Streptomyces venezuelae]CUM35799.1 hypothetical protein BN2537_563 [Streptomyces venezuelae]